MGRLLLLQFGNDVVDHDNDVEEARQNEVGDPSTVTVPEWYTQMEATEARLLEEEEALNFAQTVAQDVAAAPDEVRIAVVARTMQLVLNRKAKLGSN